RASLVARSNAFHAALTTVALAAALAAGGCAGAGDVDRSQPDKLDKAKLFLNADGSPKVFYYQWTFVGVPPTNGWAYEGMQSMMEKVYFKIEETQLVGYRAYAYAPGSENSFNGG